MPPLHACRRIAALSALAISLTVAGAAQSGAPLQTAGNFQSLVQSANAARDSGNPDQAIRDYSHAVALRHNWAEGWWNLGALQYETNHYAEAVTSLRRLTELAPNAAAGWSMLGLSQFETKDYPGALDSLEKAQKLGGIPDPDIARVAAYHLGLLLIRNGEFERATDLLHSAFGQSFPTQVKTAFGLALLRVPLLPSEIDPSKEALIQAAGEAAANPDPQPLAALLQQYPDTPWLHYGYGLALAATGQIEQALAQQKLETTISPDNPLPWIEISGLALRLRHPQQALSAAKHAIALNADCAAAHIALAKVLSASGKVQQAALETRQAARLAQTPPRRDPRIVALYLTYPAAAPENSATWKAIMQDYSAGRYPQTVAALKSWIEQNPSDGTAWAVMGLSEFALKDYANARIHLQRGINLGLKGSAEALQLATDSLAALLIRDRQFDTATSLLKPIAGKAPMAAETQLALGLAVLRIPSLPDDLNTSQRDLVQSAGAIVELLFASRYSEAFPAFQKLIASHPSTPWLHYAYGDALDALSQYDQAKAQMQAELKLSLKNPLPWIKLASIDVRQHQPADALHAAQTAVDLAPDSAEAHYQLGRAWLETGDAKKSIAELEKANSIKPNTPEIHFVLARAYAKANLPEKAAAERAAFMQLRAIANQNAPQRQPSVQDSPE